MKIITLLPSCAGSKLHLWDVNGVPVAEVDTVPGPGDPVQVFLETLKDALL